LRAGMTGPVSSPPSPQSSFHAELPLDLNDKIQDGARLGF
jgi:hypothetical protein